jgi:hypothetical protein
VMHIHIDFYNGGSSDLDITLACGVSSRQVRIVSTCDSHQCGISICDMASAYNGTCDAICGQ